VGKLSKEAQNKAREDLDSTVSWAVFSLMFFVLVLWALYLGVTRPGSRPSVCIEACRSIALEWVAGRSDGCLCGGSGPLREIPLPAASE